MTAQDIIRLHAKAKYRVTLAINFMIERYSREIDNSHNCKLLTRRVWRYLSLVRLIDRHSWDRAKTGCRVGRTNAGKNRHALAPTVSFISAKIHFLFQNISRDSRFELSSELSLRFRWYERSSLAGIIVSVSDYLPLQSTSGLST